MSSEFCNEMVPSVNTERLAFQKIQFPVATFYENHTYQKTSGSHTRLLPALLPRQLLAPSLHVGPRNGHTRELQPVNVTDHFTVNHWITVSRVTSQAERKLVPPGAAQPGNFDNFARKIFTDW